MTWTEHKSDQVETTATRVLISVLNWNTHDATLKCVDSLLRQETALPIKFEILVIDNGSTTVDFDHVANAIPRGVRLLRNESNLGFAGGHNIAIQEAIDRDVAFIWLCNSDAVIDDKLTLQKLVELMVANPTCGAASPKLANDDGKVYFSGGNHDWANQHSAWTPEATSLKLEVTSPSNRWVSGALMLLRVDALKSVGLLNDRYFAYFEDNELSARLCTAGWHCKVAFTTVAIHPLPKSDHSRGSYYFYLMQRNFLFFWMDNTPPMYRRFLKLKLLDRAFYECNKLVSMGLDSHAKAALLGIYDFAVGRSGAPDLHRKVPLGIILARRLLAFKHRRVRERLATPVRQ